MEFTAVEISNLINGQIIGDESVKVHGFSHWKAEKGAFVIYCSREICPFFRLYGEFNSYRFQKIIRK